MLIVQVVQFLQSVPAAAPATGSPHQAEQCQLHRADGDQPAGEVRGGGPRPEDCGELL